MGQLVVWVIGLLVYCLIEVDGVTCLAAFLLPFLFDGVYTVVGFVIVFRLWVGFCLVFRLALYIYVSWQCFKLGVLFWRERGQPHGREKMGVAGPVQSRTASSVRQGLAGVCTRYVCKCTCVCFFLCVGIIVISGAG